MFSNNADHYSYQRNGEMWEEGSNYNSYNYQEYYDAYEYEYNNQI